MQLTWWGRWQPPGAQSSDDRALSRQVEHQYRVEPEEDARSEGTQGSQEAAQGKLAALDIDLCCSWWLRVRLGSAAAGAAAAVAGLGSAAVARSPMVRSRGQAAGEARSPGHPG